MKRIALIINGLVEMVATWDGVSEWNPGSEYALVDVTDSPWVGKGCAYDGANFVPPAE